MFPEKKQKSHPGISYLNVTTLSYDANYSSNAGKIIVPIIFFVISTLITACAASGGFFKAGTAANIFMMVILAVIILWVISAIRNRQ
ncbi:hypothetical protein ABZR88_11065 [Mucilaginibacter yixingensis]|uniref:hypothetical protein n=1 Tax=Mucilaginibacter yixingensis TaxID=1295612 RepID=UPI0011B2017A|nr:hypothetical protein [Mucilaginibacter yixingensis]